jgi:hypothetical protein
MVSFLLAFPSISYMHSSSPPFVLYFRHRTMCPYIMIPSSCCISYPLRLPWFHNRNKNMRHELPSLARTLGSWVLIPLKAWMFGVCMRLFCVCVVLCLDRGLATGWSLIHPRGPTVCEKMIIELIKRPGPWMGWKSHWEKNKNRWSLKSLKIMIHYIFVDILLS